MVVRLNSSRVFWRSFMKPWLLWWLALILPLIVVDTFWEVTGPWTQLWAFLAILGIPIIPMISYVKTGWLKKSAVKYVYNRFMFTVMGLFAVAILWIMVWYYATLDTG